MPVNSPVINIASGSSLWFETDWSVPDNYSTSFDVDTISFSGEVKLRYDCEVYVIDSRNHRIVKTRMDGSSWSTYGTKGSGKGQFFFSRGGINGDFNTGNIYVADTDNHRIVKTMMNGTGWTSYGTKGSGNGQLNSPFRLYYDNSTENLYVSDWYNYRIVKTTMNGTNWTTYGSYGSGSGQFNGPGGISYDSSSGFVYLLDVYNNRIVKTMMNGSGWTTYGTLGGGKGQFSSPNGIFYDSSSEFIYVADSGNGRIVKTKINGSGWTTYGTRGSGKGQFSSSFGIYFDSNTGYIFVTDLSNNRIVKTKINGNGWTAYGTKGSGKGQFEGPDDISISESNYSSEGYLISRYYNCGEPTNFKTLNWSAITPSGTSVKYQLKTALSSTGMEIKDFVGPDGTTSTYYTASGTTIWTGHTGDSWIQYKLYLSSTDGERTPILKDVTIIYNLLPNQPTLISPTDGTWTNDNTPTFTWFFNDTDSSAQIGYQWQLDDNIEFNNIDYDSNKITSSQSSNTPTTPIVDGIWYWRIRTKDSDGDWGPYCLPWKIQIDTKAPSSTIDMPINKIYYTYLDTISGTASDPQNGSGLKKVEIAIKSLNNSHYWNGKDWMALETWLLTVGTTTWSYDSSSIQWNSGTQYIVCSRAIDNTFNVEIPKIGNEFTMDFDRPLSIIENPSNNTYLNTLKSIFGRVEDIGGSGIDLIEVSIYRINDKTHWDGSGWKFGKYWLAATGIDQWFYNSSKVMWTTDTRYIIRSRGTDNVGLREIPSNGNTFMYDNQPPSLFISINNDDIFTNSTSVILSLEAEDTGSGVFQMSFSTDNTTWSDWEEIDTTKQYSLPTYDGTKTVYFKVQDRVGNIAGPISDSIILDTTPPEQLSVIINDDDEYTNSSIVSLSLNAIDRLSGLNKMSFSYNGNTWSYWEPFNIEKYIKLLLGDGEKIVYFKVNDNAGNNAIISDTIILDTEPPYSLFIVINRGTYETNSTSVNLILHAKDDTSGLSQMAFSSDSLTWTPWENYRETKNYFLSTGDGHKNVYFKVIDKAGNIAEPERDTILLNTSLPVLKTEEDAINKKITSNYINIELIIIIFIIITIIIITIVHKRRRQKRLEEKEKISTPTVTYSPSKTQVIVPNLQASPMQPLRALGGNIVDGRTQIESISPSTLEVRTHEQQLLSSVTISSNIQHSTVTPEPHHVMAQPLRVYQPPKVPPPSVSIPPYKPEEKPPDNETKIEHIPLTPIQSGSKSVESTRLNAIFDFEIAGYTKPVPKEATERSYREKE